MSDDNPAVLRALRRVRPASLADAGESSAALYAFLLDRHGLSSRAILAASPHASSAMLRQLDLLTADPSRLTGGSVWCEGGFEDCRAEIVRMLRSRRQLLLRNAVPVEEPGAISRRAHHPIPDVCHTGGGAMPDCRLEPPEEYVRDLARQRGRMTRRGAWPMPEPGADAWMKLQLMERKSDIWKEFLEKESVATVVGAFMLIVLVTVMVVASFIDRQISDILANSFLILLGFFFGQGVSRRRQVPRRPSSQSTGVGRAPTER